jgi:hypothetical protein
LFNAKAMAAAPLAAAQDILKAPAPFEALPWPPDATPE